MRHKPEAGHSLVPEGAILILGGTTEGRLAAETCEQGSAAYFYSTKSDSQVLEAAHAQRLCGAMDGGALLQFCLEHRVKLIVDAAHPFARNLHANALEVAQRAEIPIVRFNRKPLEPIHHPDVRYLPSLQSALHELLARPVERLLVLAGVNSLPILKPYWCHHFTLFRVMPLRDSLAIVQREGFPREQLLFFQPDESYERLIEQAQPSLILTKESGESGLFHQKLCAALDLGVPLLVIERPPLPSGYSRVVYGPEGLRMAIQDLMPGFFPLRTGYTTGTCATAATRGALQQLLCSEGTHGLTNGASHARSTWVNLPSGEPLEIPVEYVAREDDSTALACVVKNSGDDPDVTHGFSIYSRVKLSTEGGKGGIDIIGGEGVGRVTLPGLGLSLGEAAINSTPRRMIAETVVELLKQHGLPPEHTRVEVTISVPEGVEAAERTYNPRLGIRGGISIIGTTGIVRPFSHEAFISSIRKSLSVAEAQGCREVVLNSGGKSEAVLRGLYPELSAAAFIHYGNAIGDTLRLLNTTGIVRVTVGLMIGKAVKLAEGFLDTHSAKNNFNSLFLANIATEQGCSSSVREAIESISLARDLWAIVPPPHPFYRGLLSKCFEVCRAVVSPTVRVQLILIAEDGACYPYPAMEH